MLVRLAILFILIANAATSFAQGEFIAGYGIFSSGEIGSDSFKPSVTSITTLDGDYNTFTNGIGPWVVGYKYEMSEKFSLGVLGVVSTFKTNYFGNTLHEGLAVDSKQSVSTNQLSTLARVYYSWIRFDNLTIYSSMAAGISYGNFRNSSENIHTQKFAPAYQANVLGIRAGGRLGAYLELGYGYAGVANVGVSLYLK